MTGNVNSSQKLDRVLGPLMLWGLGVGYVISGMYFGWNLGLPAGGTAGLAIATFFIIILYVTFTFSYTELACAIPKAGGAFDYADRALGPTWGFVGGLVQIIEFVFAPPAIAAAIGAYFHLFFPGLPVLGIAIIAYFIFTALNIYGVKAAAAFELGITIFAVVELLIFAGVTLPHFQWSSLVQNSYPHGFRGVLAAIPFAIWFFLGIEGVANVAEETINPQKNVLLGFGSALFTLVILCVLTFVAAIGVGGWESIVYPAPGASPSDSPLPLALAQIVGQNNFFYHLLVTIGLFGLIASFHGIILAAGRATFEFGRVGYAPRFLGKTSRFKTPALALLANMVIGIAALLTGKTAEIITLACFGALSLYIISMVALFRLRKREPALARPFRVPGYPYSPLIAFAIATFSLLAMIAYNHLLAFLYFAFVGISVVGFRKFVLRSKKGLQ
ncbi:MAG: ethanolamine permease [Deltaproteobacteria bacterium]|nr:ethanolamine permease [Deltaproteobacteria bacterium]